MAFPIFAAAGAVALRFAPQLLRVVPRAASALRRPATLVGPGVLRPTSKVVTKAASRGRIAPVGSAVGFKKQAVLIGGSTVAGGALGGFLSGRGPAAGVGGVIDGVGGTFGRAIAGVTGFTWDALPPFAKGAVVALGGVGVYAGYKAVKGKLKT